MGSCLSKKNKSDRTSEREVAEGDEIREDDLRGIFREFDINGDGFIQKNELRAVMIKMGQSPTDEELAAMFSAADKDNDGNIDFNEFLTIARANPLSLSLKAVFEELDVDGDGHITRSELRTAFQRNVDLNHDGKINFKEFCQMMTRNKK
ncbi:CRE-CAL-5 protein [Aphelenchoides besseyi]|nr:CRE-CAL-5 protein [Aphelenchoides besseyi]KAI6207665.1 CRE-CAL-5 protein [Aphelenchoides besseyi]